MPPDDHVVDTNVLLLASASDAHSPFKDSTHVPLAEQRLVLEWLIAFRKDRTRHLVLDSQQELMREYRKQLGKNDYGYKVIVEKLQSARFHRIELDEEGAAQLPEPLRSEVKDRSDRKFVAVVLADGGQSSLVNACDTDWYDCENALKQAGIKVDQLISGWCRAKHAEKNAK
ncbi:hypothetical protein SAMN05444354_103354 [Stigmatella aurantiaca]|uniref:PIN domain-containing protein n=1 Tax=Stigmatella aurantiaca TaxID=41 RepID=A0A1H7LW10_STIAU|nr:hypothetical protein [Stigmatella aurantiaca]SEL03049.1 hypothetical protein SAMN05444354_103354 [Stigmatella aurantiaca]